MGFLILLGCFAFLTVVFVVAMFRVNWVYHKRIDIINTRFSDYDKYEDFDYMMKKWWIWDIEKFRKSGP